MYSDRIKDIKFLEAIDSVLLTQLLNINIVAKEQTGLVTYNVANTAIKLLTKEQKESTINAINHIVDNLNLLKEELQKN